MTARSILAVAGLLLLPAACAADAFSEYRIPDHSWRSGTSQFGAWASRGRESNPVHVRTDRSANAQFSAAIQLGRDGDRFSRSFAASVAGALAGSRGESSTGPGAWRSDFRTGDGARRLELHGAQRAYPWSSAWAAGVAVDAHAEFSQYWQRQDHVSNDFYRTLSRTFRSNDHYTYLGSAALTLGRGRVRDATVVMDVHVLEERLLAAGTLAGPLAPATRGRLAEVLLAGREIDAAHERPDRYFWREVERVLREGGALGAAGLDAYSVMRVREPYAQQRLARLNGAYAGLRLGGEHRQDVVRGQDEYATRYLQGDSLVFGYNDNRYRRSATGADDVFAGIEAEIHRPLGWRWQLDAAGSIAVPVSTDDHGLNSATRLAVDWIVADRWRAGVSFASERTYLRHGDDPVTYVRDRWTARLASFASYFIEDHLSLTAQWAIAQQRYEDAGQLYSAVHQLSLGLTYRFLGRFGAPGLIEPMRPLS